MNVVRFLMVSVLSLVAFGSVGAVAQADYISTVVADNPRGFWPLNETSGTTANDLSWQGTGNLLGNTIAAANNGTHTNVTAGVAGIPNLGAAAGYVEASGSYTNITANNYYTPSLGAANTGWTAEIWMKTTSSTESTALWWYDFGSGQDLYFLDTLGSGKVQAFARDDSGTAANMISTSPINDGNFHHVVMTFGYDAGNTAFEKLYIDGALDVSQSVALGTFTGSGPLAVLGAYPGTWPSPPAPLWTGSLNGAAIYATALTDAQVLAHYEAGITGGPVTPEPSSIVLGLMGFAALSVARRFRKRNAG